MASLNIIPIAGAATISATESFLSNNVFLSFLLKSPINIENRSFGVKILFKTAFTTLAFSLSVSSIADLTLLLMTQLDLPAKKKQKRRVNTIDLYFIK